MSLVVAPLGPVRPAFLTRVTPVARLAGGMTWLVASILTLDPIVPVRLIDGRGRGPGAVVRAAAGPHTPPAGPARLRHPEPDRLLDPAVGLKPDRSLAALVEFGPVRITAPAVSAGLAIGLRVVVIGLTTLLVFGPSDTTRMADSLVQQWRIPDRFAYGAVAALRVAPFMAERLGAHRRRSATCAASGSGGAVDGSAMPGIGCWSCSWPPSAGRSDWPWQWTRVASTAASGEATSASCASAGATG